MYTESRYIREEVQLREEISLISFVRHSMCLPGSNQKLGRVKTRKVGVET